MVIKYPTVTATITNITIGNMLLPVIGLIILYWAYRTKPSLPLYVSPGFIVLPVPSGLVFHDSNTKPSFLGIASDISVSTPYFTVMASISSLEPPSRS